MLLMIMNTTLYVRNRVRMRKKTCLHIYTMYNQEYLILNVDIYGKLSVILIFRSQLFKQWFVLAWISISSISNHRTCLHEYLSKRHLMNIVFGITEESLQPDTITLNTKFNLNDWTMAKASVKYWRIYGAYVILINPIVVVSDTHWKNPN